MLHSKPACTPLHLHFKLTPDEETLLTEPTTYRALIGKLSYLTNTRPDLCFAVQTLSHYMQTPRSSHMQALFHILRYLHGTIGQGILLQSSDHIEVHVLRYNHKTKCDWLCNLDGIISYELEV